MEKNIYIFKINEDKVDRTLFSIIMNLEVLTSCAQIMFELTKNDGMFTIKTDSYVAASTIIDLMELRNIKPTNQEIETKISLC
jgi:hypothetical protein